MSVISREKQDRILKSYILEFEKLVGNNFKYAETQGCAYDEKWVEDKIKVIAVLYERKQDMAFLTKKIAKLTAKYNKRTSVIIQPVLQWEDDRDREEVIIS